MPVQEMDGQRLCQAFEVEASIRIAGLHLLFQRPADVFNLGIPRLETIDDLNLARVQAGLFRYGFQQALRYAYQEDRVAFLHFPPAWSARGNDVGITVYADPPMRDASSFTLHQYGTSDVNGNGCIRPGRNFHHSGRVRSQTYR